MSEEAEIFVGNGASNAARTLSRVHFPNLFNRLALSLVALGAAVLLIVLPALEPSKHLSIAVDMKVSGGGQAGLYVNSFNRPPRLLEILPGVREQYVFGESQDDIHLLRLDLGRQVSTEIEIFGVTVTHDGVVVKSFSPQDLTSWTPSGLGSLALAEDSLKMVATSSTPTLQSTSLIQFRGRQPGAIAALFETLGGATTYEIFALCVAALCILLELPWRRWPPVALVLLVGYFGAGLVVGTATRHIHSLGSASTAVGGATFRGLSASANVNGTRAALGVGLVVAVSLAVSELWWARRKAARAPRAMAERVETPVVPSSETSPTYRSEARGYRLVRVILDSAPWLLVAGSLLRFLPNLRVVLRGSYSAQFVNQWDANNVLAWDAYSSRGLTPLRDFWFPYGNREVFTSTLVWGPLLQFLVRALMVCLFCRICFILGKRSKWKASLAATTLVMLTPFMPGYDRYLLALITGLSLVTAVSTANSSRLDGTLFGLAFVGTLFIDPALILYSAPALIVVSIIELFKRRSAKSAIGELARRVGTIPAAGTMLWLLTTALRGQFQGAKDLYTRLSVSATYSALPTDLLQATRQPFSLRGVVLLSPIACAAVGCYAVCRTKGQSLLGSLFFCLGLVGFVILQKHVVRPIDDQLMLVPLVALLLLTAAAPSLRGKRAAVTRGVGLGVFASWLLFVGSFGLFRSDIRRLPATMFDDINLLVRHYGEIAAAESQRFDAKHFGGFPNEQAVAQAVKARLSPSQLAFVLGDAPELYVLLGQRPPYQGTFYDASPIYEQRKVVEWINSRRPALVLLDRTASFADQDGVPNLVRAPLIFAAVVTSYVPDSAVGTYNLLRPRKPTEEIAVDYWRQVLGSDFTAGALGAVSSINRLKPCDGSKACHEFLRVHLDSRPSDGWIHVPVVLGGQSFSVSMLAVPGQVDYALDLDRAWFWGPMQAAGLRPQVDRSSEPSGLAIGVESRAVDSSTLY